MKQLMRLLREPLFHFLVIGGLLFSLYSAVSGPAPAPVNSIVIESERVTQLAAAYEAVWRRPPSERELRALVDDFVREEVYYREALALGLERDDTIIRRRLRQKMEFLTDSGADLIQPKSGELEAYYSANKQKFVELPRIALEQIYLGENPRPENIAAALAAMQSDTTADPFLWSVRTMLPSRLELSTPDSINGVFGAGFFDALAQLPRAVWSGPVESGYGVHLVRVNNSLPARQPLLVELREEILGEWKTERAQELREQVYARLLERYIVQLPDGMAVDNP